VAFASCVPRQHWHNVPSALSTELSPFASNEALLVRTNCEETNGQETAAG